MTVIVRQIYDEIDVGDNTVYYSRHPIETVLLTENIETPESGIRRKAISDTVAITELVLRYRHRKVLINNTITLSDSIHRTKKLVRIIENWLGHLRYKRHISNTTTLSESISIQLKLLKHLISDTTTKSESLVVNVITNPTKFIRFISDTKTLSESISRKLRHSRTAIDRLDQKFDPAGGDIFYGKRKIKLEPTKKEEPVIVPMREGGLLGSHIRRPHRMRSI